VHGSPDAAGVASGDRVARRSLPRARGVWSRVGHQGRGRALHARRWVSGRAAVRARSVLGRTWRRRAGRGWRGRLRL